MIEQEQFQKNLEDWAHTYNKVFRSLAERVTQLEKEVEILQHLNTIFDRRIDRLMEYITKPKELKK